MSKLNIEKNIHPKKLALQFEKNKNNDKALFLEKINNIQLVTMYKFLDDDDKVLLYEKLQNKRQKEFLDLISIDDLKDLIDLQKDEKLRNKIIANLKRQRRNEIIKRSSFNYDTVSSIMSPHYKVINVGDNVKDATKYVITTSSDHDHLDLIYVVDDHFKYIGTIPLTKLISSRPTDELIDLVDESTPSIDNNTSPEKAAQMIMSYDLPTLPVTNMRHEIVGIFTYDDAFEILQEDYEKTYQKLASIGDFDTDQSPIKRTKDRIIWLLLSVVLNILIAMFLFRYEETLQTFVILVFFQPLILGMAGNIGTQSLGSTILKLNKRDNTLKQHIFKEVLITIINSIIMAILASLMVYIFMISISSPESHFMISLVIGISVLTGLIISSLFGLFLPIVLNKFGFDERAASGPLLTTINDLTAIGAYLLCATLLLM